MNTPSSPRRYLSIWLRRLATDRLARRRRPGQDEGAPLIVAQKVKSAQRIAAMNDAAARLGLAVGTALADARARHPALAVAPHDPEADRGLLETIADWCDRYTPLVGIDPPDGIMLDVTGCAHLFGGEAALARDILMRLAARGLRARIAVASTPGCAWGVARYGVQDSLPPQRKDRECGDDITPLPNPPPQGGRERAATSPQLTSPTRAALARARAQALEGEVDDRRPRLRSSGGGYDPAHLQSVSIIPTGATREALAPLPLAALRLEADTVTALADIGLHRIADVLDLPRAPLAARFGEEFRHRLDQALGSADEPITPRRPAPPYMAEQHFAEPIARERDVLGAVARLGIRLGYAMEARGEGARRLELALFRTDGKVFRIAVGTGAPLRAADRIGRLFKDRLAGLAEACDPGFGYDLVRLSALLTERYAAAQVSLADAAGAAGAPDQAGEIGHLIDRLGARLGRRRVTRLMPQDTHIPEFAAAALPAHAARTPALPGLLLPSPPAGEGGKDRRSEPGEGESRRRRAGGIPPHPPRSRMLARHPLPQGERERQTTPFPVSFAFPEAEADTLAPARPVRLFTHPERIEVIAEVPDGPPVRFRWRRVLHEVAAAEGPERIALEWWRDAEGRALTRDYFRIECRAGARVWLFREGLYIRETAAPRWFLHGLFG